MRPDILLISEMIDAAEQARQLAAGVSATDLERDRQRRDALLWNFTVLGEAAARLSGDTQARFPNVQWQQPARLRNRVVSTPKSIGALDSGPALVAHSPEVGGTPLPATRQLNRWL
jgi:uncharacterized protein with HEPN domain